MLQLSRRSVAKHRLVARSFVTARDENSSKEQIKQDHTHCVELVRERDKEGYLCGLLMPSHTTRAYFSLKAFNAEIAAIKDGHSRSPLQRSEGTSFALQMRMQWWMDAVDQIYNQNSSTSPRDDSYWHSPVVRSLYRARDEFSLTRRFLERLIESRRADLDITQYSTMEDLISYAEDSVSTLLYLSLETLGVGIGLVTAIRSIPYNLQLHENLSVPADVLKTETSRQRDDLLLSLLAEEDSPIAPLTEQQRQIWNDAVREMVAVASLHLSKAQQLQTQVPRTTRAAFLPVVPSMLYLSQLQGPAQYNVFDPALNDPRKGV